MNKIAGLVPAIFIGSRRVDAAGVRGVDAVLRAGDNSGHHSDIRLRNDLPQKEAI